MNHHTGIQTPMSIISGSADQSASAFLRRPYYRVLVTLKIISPSTQQQSKPANNKDFSLQKSMLVGSQGAGGVSPLPTSNLFSQQQVYKQLNIMVPATPKDTITTFLNDVAKAYHLKNPNDKIKCDQLLVEDHYEVDERYSVEECLGDMFRVLVIATKLVNTKNGKQAQETKNQQVIKASNKNDSILGKRPQQSAPMTTSQLVQEASKKLIEQRDQSSFKKALTSQTLIQPPKLQKIRSLSSSSSEEEAVQIKIKPKVDTTEPVELTKKQKKKLDKKLRKKQLKEQLKLVKEEDTKIASIAVTKATHIKQVAKVAPVEVAKKEMPKKEAAKKEVQKAPKNEEVKTEVIKKVEVKEVRSESSESSESLVSLKDKLIRQISESISNYSLEEAYVTAGVETPKRSVPGSPLASSSSSMSIHASPVKAQPVLVVKAVEIPIEKKPIVAQKQQTQTQIKPTQSAKKSTPQLLDETQAKMTQQKPAGKQTTTKKTASQIKPAPLINVTTNKNETPHTNGVQERKDSEWSSLSSDDEKQNKKAASTKKQEAKKVQEVEEEDEFSKFLQIQSSIKKNRKNSVNDNNLLSTNSFLGKNSSLQKQNTNAGNVSYPNLFD